LRKRIDILAAILLFAAAAANVTVIALTLNNDRPAARLREEETVLSVTVTDAESGAPIERATVCIPEINGYYYTDAAGKTIGIALPLLVDGRYEAIAPRDYGVVTLYVYKDGYIDYIVFELKLTASPREASARLYKKITDSAPGYQAVTEPAAPRWVEDMIDRYRK
jgi:hypothetical protein